MTFNFSPAFVDEITLLLLEEGTDVFLLVFDAMDTFSDNEEIQKYGCHALQTLLEKGIFLDHCVLLAFVCMMRGKKHKSDICTLRFPGERI